MGFFDRFRKIDAERNAGDGQVFQEIVSFYSLKRAKPYEPSIAQDWWEGSYGAMRFAVQALGKDIHVYLGDVVEVTEIYLGRVHPGGTLPPESSPQRLDRIAGPEGAELAKQFVLLAHPQGDFDYPQLRLPALIRGIPRLSQSVGEIALYENFRGLSLILNQPLTMPNFENDLRIASEIIKALSS